MCVCVEERANVTDSRENREAGDSCLTDTNVRDVDTVRRGIVLLSALQHSEAGIRSPTDEWGQDKQMMPKGHEVSTAAISNRALTLLPQQKTEPPTVRAQVCPDPTATP